jgi:isopenicillin-N epimerase
MPSREPPGPETSQESHLRPWGLAPDVVHLNHGAFGACPLPVLEHQTELRRRLEADPSDFFVRRLEGELDAARETLGAFLGADPEGLAFVSNATSGVNAVLRSLEPELERGCELLATEHVYNASRNALDVTAQRTGARVVLAEIPFPAGSAQELCDAVLARVTSRTRLALIDHVTSPSALVLPLDRLIPELQARGVSVLVDGAHAPGSVPLALGALDADYYAGNGHKWLCAPKGAGFLYVRAELRSRIRPNVISHGASMSTARRERFRNEFDWQGTLDPTPWLCIPEAIRCVGALLPGGWPALIARNHALVLEARRILCEGLGIAPPVPDALLGCMASLPLEPIARDAETRDPLEVALFERHRIEVPVLAASPRLPRLLRVSAHVYNRREDYVALLDALRELGPTRRSRLAVWRERHDLDLT